MSDETPSESSEVCDLQIEQRQTVVEMKLSGRVSVATTGSAWTEALAALGRSGDRAVVIDCAGIRYCDGAGMALLAALEQRGAGRVELRDLPPDIRTRLDRFDRTKIAAGTKQIDRPGVVERAGREAVKFLQEIREQIAFVGKLSVVGLGALARPSQIRWRDVMLVAERTGANAFPIVAVIGLLMGLIMAFQSALPMKQFGVEIFVADLVAISMVKELGPLMAAVVMAGRSGSAFAAELGTMSVNEEIDALSTMGIDPVRFLVVTRVLAAVLMSPLLAVFCVFFGLVGGAVVLLSLGYPLVTYVDRVVATVSLSAFLSGMTKAWAFGLLVGGIGCLRGLQTGSGASAVGDSATRAVVSGIVLIVLTDAAFSIMFYALGI